MLAWHNAINDATFACCNFGSSVDAVTRVARIAIRARSRLLQGIVSAMGTPPDGPKQSSAPGARNDRDRSHERRTRPRGSSGGDGPAAAPADPTAGGTLSRSRRCFVCSQEVVTGISSPVHRDCPHVACCVNHLLRMETEWVGMTCEFRDFDEHWGDPAAFSASRRVPLSFASAAAPAASVPGSSLGDATGQAMSCVSSSHAPGYASASGRNVTTDVPSATRVPVRAEDGSESIFCPTMPATDFDNTPHQKKRYQEKVTHARRVFVAVLSEWVNMHDWHEPFAHGPPSVTQSCATEDGGRLGCNKPH